MSFEQFVKHILEEALKRFSGPAEMPVSRRAGAKRELAKRVAKGEITADDYKRITGEDYDVT